MAKASDQNGFDGEGRKLGEQNGLDSPFLASKKAEPKSSAGMIPKTESYEHRMLLLLQKIL
jgi:hypothetical protein